MTKKDKASPNLSQPPLKLWIAGMLHHSKHLIIQVKRSNITIPSEPVQLSSYAHFQNMLKDHGADLLLFSMNLPSNYKLYLLAGYDQSQSQTPCMRQSPRRTIYFR